MKQSILILILLSAFIYGAAPKPFELACAAGEVPGCKSVNKFGRAMSGVQVTATDIWDRADASATQSVWAAPTAARYHYITSTSSQDSVWKDSLGARDSTGGTGAHILIIWGLPSWDSVEVSDTVVMNGITGDTTGRPFVIIHRMKVDSSGTSDSSNVGIIQAMALVDSTITAELNPGDGQTQMCIYGVPSVQDFYLAVNYLSINKASGAAVDVNFTIAVNEKPNLSTSDFLIKSVYGATSDGSSAIPPLVFKPFKKITGPAIIKIQGTASAADVDASAGFDGYLLDK